jgi:hypothetical protein
MPADVAGSSDAGPAHLGHYPGLSLTDARAKAGEWYQLVKLDKDPTVVAQEARAAAQSDSSLCANRGALPQRSPKPGIPATAAVE